MTEKLAIKLDGKVIKSDAFVKAVTNFFRVASNVSAEMPVGEVEWGVQVKEGSNIVIGEPILKSRNEDTKASIISVIFNGIDSINSGRVERPRFFTDHALNGLRALALVEAEEVTIQSNGSAVRIGRTTASTIDVILGTVHKSFGDVEGRLSVLRDKGEVTFYITEPVHGQEVTCYITREDIIQKAVSAWRRRVSASGLVKYRRNGTPISVDVDELRIFEDIGLPTTDEIIGIYHR